MKITFVIYSLDMGGAEHVMSGMANHLARAGHAVSLVTLHDIEDYYPLDACVRRLRLGASGRSRSLLHALFANFRRLRRLRRAVRDLEPDVIVSFTTRLNVLTLLATSGLQVPVIVSERTDPTQVRLPPAWRVLRRLTYRRARRVVVPCEEILHKSRKFMPGARLVVIPNPLLLNPGTDDGPALRIALELPAGTHIVMAMGRFDPAKGFDLLIRSFARVAGAFPSWHLVIVGDGNERAQLLRLIAEHRLAGRVHLPGRTRVPRALLVQADIFVLPSRFEGFPNVLLEAMACGLPVVSFACPSGPREIIRHEVDGLLVEAGRSDELVRALERLMTEPEMRGRLGHEAKAVRERYALDTVMESWMRHIRGVLHTDSESGA